MKEMKKEGSGEKEMERDRVEGEGERDKSSDFHTQCSLFSHLAGLVDRCSGGSCPRCSCTPEQTGHPSSPKALINLEIRKINPHIQQNRFTCCMLTACQQVQHQPDPDSYGNYLSARAAPT